MNLPSVAKSPTSWLPGGTRKLSFIRQKVGFLPSISTIVVVPDPLLMKFPTVTSGFRTAYGWSRELGSKPLVPQDAIQGTMRLIVKSLSARIGQRKNSGLKMSTITPLQAQEDDI